MQTIHVHSLQETESFAHDFIHSLSPSRVATVVTLSGELGAGKTTFIQSVARALGITETVSSPTFVIEKIYTLKEQSWERLVHIDAYRLKGESELTLLGWKEIVEDPANLIFLEWPERITGSIPMWARCIRFDIEGEARIISVYDRSESTEENNKDGSEKSV